jgi:hypothetical protein
MLELPFLNPDELNRDLPKSFRIASVVLLAFGAVLTLIIAVQTARNWSSSPHPAAFLIFIGSITLLAIWVAARLARGARVAQPVAAPVRPFIVRILGLVLFVFCGLAALVSSSFIEREIIGGIALGGLGWFLWPRGSSGHAA